MMSTYFVVDIYLVYPNQQQRRARRSWTANEKRRIVAETHPAGVSVSSVARRHGLNANQLFNWLRDPRFDAGAPALLPVDVAIDDSGDEQPSASAPPSRIEIALPNGARLCCDADIDPQALTRVITALWRSA